MTFFIGCIDNAVIKFQIDYDFIYLYRIFVHLYPSKIPLKCSCCFFFDNHFNSCDKILKIIRIEFYFSWLLTSGEVDEPWLHWHLVTDFILRFVLAYYLLLMQISKYQCTCLYRKKHAYMNERPSSPLVLVGFVLLNL